MYTKTDENLRNSLIENGFKAYPSQPNKYWNADGRVVWTEGDLYQKDTEASWSRYEAHDSDNQHV